MPARILPNAALFDEVEEFPVVVMKRWLKLEVRATVSESRKAVKYSDSDMYNPMLGLSLQQNGSHRFDMLRQTIESHDVHELRRS